MKKIFLFLSIISASLVSCTINQNSGDFTELQDYDVLLSSKRTCGGGGVFTSGSDCQGENALFYFFANSKKVYRYSDFSDLGDFVYDAKLINDELWLSVSNVELNIVILDPETSEIIDRFSSENTVEEIVELDNNRVLLRNKIYNTITKTLIHEIYEDYFIDAKYLDGKLFIQNVHDILIIDATNYELIEDIDVGPGMNVYDVTFSKDHYYLSTYNTTSKKSSLVRLPRSNPTKDELESIDVTYLGMEIFKIRIISNTAFIYNSELIFEADLSNWNFEPFLTNKIEHITTVGVDYINNLLYVHHRNNGKDRIAIINSEKELVKNFVLKEGGEGLEKIIVL